MPRRILSQTHFPSLLLASPTPHPPTPHPLPLYISQSTIFPKIGSNSPPRNTRGEAGRPVTSRPTKRVTHHPTTASHIIRPRISQPRITHLPQTFVRPIPFCPPPPSPLTVSPPPSTPGTSSRVARNRPQAPSLLCTLEPTCRGLVIKPRPPLPR